MSINFLSTSGNFLYVGKGGDATACNGTAGNAIGCELLVFDISTPSNPTLVAGRDVKGDSSGTGNVDINSLITSGNYLYVGKLGDATACNGTAGNALGCELLVFDISAPSSPTLVAGRDAVGDATGVGNKSITTLAVVANSLYAGKIGDGTACNGTVGNAIGCELLVFDISTPSAPTLIGGRDASGDSTGVAAQSIQFLTHSGNSLYVGKAANATACNDTIGNAIGCELIVFADTSLLSGSLIAGSAFNHLTISRNVAMGNNASTTGNLTINSGASLSAPPLLSSGGNYTNSGIFTHNSGLVYLNGSSPQTLSGTMIASSSFYNLTILNNSGTSADTNPSVIFANTSSTTGTFTATVSSTSIRFPASATSSIVNLTLSGASAVAPIFLRSSTPGTYAGLSVSGTTNVTYADIKDSNVCAGYGNITAQGSTDSGHNLCWSFLSALLVSGTLYSNEGVSAYTAGGEVLKLRVGTTTPGIFSTTTLSGTGNYQFTVQNISAGQPLSLWVDSDAAFRAFAFTKASSSLNNLTNFNLFKNYVIVKHEGFSGTSTTNADLGVYDSDDNPSIMFTANGGTYAQRASTTLYIAPGTEYKPGGTVTLHGNAGGSGDGDLRLATGLRQDGVASSSILTMGSNALTLAGSWMASSTSIYSSALLTTFNSSSTAQKQIIATSSIFQDLSFGSICFCGTWSFGQYAATATEQMNISFGGTVIAPSSSLTVRKLGGIGFVNNGGTVIFSHASDSSIIDSAKIGANSFNNVIFRGAGTKTFGAYAASTTNFTIESTSGTVTLPSTQLTIAGDFTNASTTGGFAHNGGTVYFGSTTGSVAQTLSGFMTGTSSFASVNFLGAGTKGFSNNASTTGDFIIGATSGAVTAPSGLLTIAGNYTNNGTFTNNGGKVYFGGTVSGLFPITYDSGGSQSDIAYSITIDSSNNVYVAGYQGTNGADWAIRKYNANGVLCDGLGACPAWGAGSTGMVTYNSGGLQADAANSITIDSSSNIYVAGYQYYVTGSDWAVRKYNANGVLCDGLGACPAWGSGSTGMVTYTGTPYNRAQAITIDSSNNIYVAGYQNTNGTDVSIRKYNANGVLCDGLGACPAWGAGSTGMVTYNSGGTQNDEANAITIDASRNIYVAGDQNTNGSDFAILEYNTSGTLNTLSANSHGSLVGSSAFGNVEIINAFSLDANASTSALTIGSTASVTAPYLLSIGGNYTNSGSFNNASGLVYLNGSSQQTLSGGMTGNNAFNNLTILNNSGTSADTNPSIIFANTSSTTGTFTAAVSSTSIRFPASATTSIGNLTLSGASAVAPIFIRSSTPGTYAGLSVSGATNVTYADVKDSAACAGYPNISATYSTDSGHNLCWTFLQALLASGTLYSDEGTTAYTTGGEVLKLRVGTSTPGFFSTTTLAGTGFYQFTGLTNIAAGQPLSLWVDSDPTFRAYAFTKASSSVNNLTNFSLYKDRILIKNEGGAGTTTRNVDLGVYDNDDNSSIQFTSNSNNFVSNAGEKVIVAYGTEYAPGGTVTTNSSSTMSAPSGDFQLEQRNGTSSIITMGGTLSIAGSYYASTSAIMNTNGYGVLLTASTTGKSILGTLTGAGAFASTTFNGVGGGWTFGSNASTSGNFTIATGTVTAPSGLLTIGGNYLNNGVFSANGGTTTMSSTSAQILAGTMIGSSAFSSINFLNAGTKSFLNSASSTGNFTIESSSGAVTAPSGLLTIGGNYTNSGTFSHNSGTIDMNPVTSPFTNLVAGRDITGDSTGIGNTSYIQAFTTSGNYLYVGRQGDATACNGTPGNAIGCELQVYDISVPSNPTLVAGRDVKGDSTGIGNIDIYSLTISGNYLYVGKAGDATACNGTAGNAIGCELLVFDISTPGNPTLVAGRDVKGDSTGTGNSVVILSLTTSGNYLYVGDGNDSTACNGTAGNAIGCELQVYDISTPSNPTLIAGRDVDGSSTGTGSAVSFFSLTISGNYLFAAKSANLTACNGTPGNAIGCELQVYDISTPSNPTLVAGRDTMGNSTGTGNVGINVITISGNYLYVGTLGNATACNGTVGNAIGCELQVYDISTPGSPTLVAGRDVKGDSSGTGNNFINTQSLIVSGSYLYVGNFNNATACNGTPGNAIGCELQVYDISTPGSPTLIAGRDVDGSSNGTGALPAQSLITSGKYLFVGKRSNATACNGTPGNAIGCELMVFGVPPTTLSGTLTGGSALNHLTIGGNVTAVSNASTSNLTINSGASFTAPSLLTIAGNYVNLGTFTAGSGKVYFSTTSYAWDVSKATYASLSKSVNAQETSPISFAFRFDGTSMYVLGTTNRTVYEYTLSTPWDVSTASYSSLSKSVSAQEPGAYSVVFSVDGSKMFILGSSNYTVYEYTLSTPWDVSTASYASLSKNVTAQDAWPLWTTFSLNGTAMYVMGTFSNKVYQYTLSTPWDVSTASYASKNKDVSANGASPQSIYFAPDGTAMYQLGNGNKTVYEYLLSTPWDVSTASYSSLSKSVNSQDGNPYGIALRPDGTALYVMGNTNKTVYQYSLSGGQRLSGTMTGSSAYNNMEVLGGGLSFQANASTSALTIGATASVTAPTLMSIGGNFTNSGLFNTNYGGLFLSGASGQTLSGTLTGNSALSSTTFLGAGTKTFSNNASTTGSFTIASGSGAVTAPSLLSVNGNYSNASTFTANGGTLYIGGYATQTLSGTMIGSSAFSSLYFSGTSTETFANNASSTGNFTIGAGATLSAPSLLTVSGNYVNRGIFSAGSGAVYLDKVQSSATLVAGRDTKGDSTGTGQQSEYSFVVSGDYLYVGNSANATACDGTAGNAIGCELQVYDISTPSNPTLVAGRDVKGDSTGTGNLDIYALTISGNYLYVGKQGDATACNGTAGNAIGCELLVFDISTPTSPTLVAGRDVKGDSTGIGNKSVISLTASGNYLYSGKNADATACNGTAGNAIGCELLVFDISTPTNPTLVAGRDVKGDSTGTGSNLFVSLAVSGGYLYAGKQANATACDGTAGNAIGCELLVFDISTPTNPTLVAGRDVKGDSTGNGLVNINSLTASGNYLYIGKGSDATACNGTAGNAIGCELLVFDISTPTNPILVAGRDVKGDSTGTGSINIDSLTASGRYLYVGKWPDATACDGTAGNAIGCELLIFDISTPSNPTLLAGRDDKGDSTGTGNIGIASLAVSGSYVFAGKNGSVTACDGTAGNAIGCELMVFQGSGQELRGSLTSSSSFNNIFFSGNGGKYFTNNASTSDFTISSTSGTVTAPPLLTISGNYTNSTTSGFNANSGKLYFGTSTYMTWNIASSTYSGLSVDTGSQDVTPLGTTFRPDGTAMYVMTAISKTLYQYSLSTPWDISTASYASKSVSVNAQDTAPYQAIFKPDGTTMYVVGDTNNTIYQFTLSTPWDVSTASYASKSVSVAAQNTFLKGMFLSPDGSEMYLAGTSGGSTVYQYTLSTPWDISTASYASRSLDVNPQGSSEYGIAFRSDGGVMYMIEDSNNAIYEYTLSTPWDISSGIYASLSKSVATQATQPYGISINPDGTSVYVTGYNTHKIYQYSLPGGQRLSGTLNGSSALNNVEVTGGGLSFQSNASTSNLTIGATASVTAPYLFSIGGNYTNNGSFNAAYSTTTFSGTVAQILSGSMTGSSAFNNLVIANGTASTTFASSASTTGLFYASTSNSRIEFAAGATTTMQNLFIGGTSGNEIYLYSATPGTKYNLQVVGSASVSYANVKDSDACSTSGGITSLTSINGGNDVCWTFAGGGNPILTLLHYRWRADNESEVSAGYYTTEDTALSNRIYRGDRVRLRLSLENTGAASSTNYDFRLEYASSSCTSWNALTPTGEWNADYSQYVAEYGSTTNDGRVSDPGGLTFVSGVIRSGSSTTGLYTLGPNKFTEHEFVIASTLSSLNTALYCFRLTNGGSTANFTYAVQPQLQLKNAARPESGGYSIEGYGTGVQQTGGNQGGGGAIEPPGGGPPHGGGGQGGGGGGLE